MPEVLAPAQCISLRDFHGDYIDDSADIGCSRYVLEPQRMHSVSLSGIRDTSIPYCSRRPDKRKVVLQIPVL